MWNKKAKIHLVQTTLTMKFLQKETYKVKLLTQSIFRYANILQILKRSSSRSRVNKFIQSITNPREIKFDDVKVEIKSAAIK